MTPDEPTTKRQLLERLLEDGMVMVTLDARFPGADAPVRLAEDPQLRLNLSYKFGLALEINDWGVRATLTFGGMPFPCKLPWPAIYAMVSHVTGEKYLFPSDVPEELIEATGNGEDAGDGEADGAGDRGRGGAAVPRQGLAARLEPDGAPPVRRGRARFALVERDDGPDEVGGEAAPGDGAGALLASGAAPAGAAPAGAAPAGAAPAGGPPAAAPGGDEASAQGKEPAAPPRKGGHLRRIK